MSDGVETKPKDQIAVDSAIQGAGGVAANPVQLAQQHLPPRTSSWWQDNWDKIVGIILSLVVGGVAGFFAAILAIQQDIHDISTRVNTLETTASTSWQSRIDKVDPLERRLADIERIMRELERSDEAEALLRERIQQIIEDTRKRTAGELREILKSNP